jgi:hypothetical protein
MGKEPLEHQPLEHLHQCSVCEPALEILDEVHDSNPVKIHWKTSGTLKTGPTFRATMDQYNKHSEIVFIDSSLFLIG